MQHTYGDHKELTNNWKRRHESIQSEVISTEKIQQLQLTVIARKVNRK